MSSKEAAACKPVPFDPKSFNSDAVLPYSCQVGHITKSMGDFLEFLQIINQKLHENQMPRLETFLMPANFSSMVGEFINTAIPKYCTTLVKNRYHNGHPDLLPKGVYADDSILHGVDGIEVKASRHKRGWQGHNPEKIWLMVFCFEANSARDQMKGIEPTPFKFIKVVGGQL